MSGDPIRFDELHKRFHFLAWPRVTVHNARYFFMYDGHKTDWNLCQVFKTNIIDPKMPLEYLLEHLSMIERYLREGVRSQINNGVRPEITCTGGLQFWMERYDLLPQPKLAVFHGRGLTYIPPLAGFGCWVSDVGLIPA